METPKLMFSFYFLFLLLVVISFGYLAIYTNEYLLLLNNVDIFAQLFLHIKNLCVQLTKKRVVNTHYKKKKTL